MTSLYKSLFAHPFVCMFMFVYKEIKSSNRLTILVKSLTLSVFFHVVGGCHGHIRTTGVKNLIM